MLLFNRLKYFFSRPLINSDAEEKNETFEMFDLMVHPKEFAYDSHLPLLPRQERFRLVRPDVSEGSLEIFPNDPHQCSGHARLSGPEGVEIPVCLNLCAFSRPKALC